LLPLLLLQLMLAVAHRDVRQGEGPGQRLVLLLLLQLMLAVGDWYQAVQLRTARCC
jgi:hypothetical protein